MFGRREVDVNVGVSLHKSSYTTREGFRWHDIENDKSRYLTFFIYDVDDDIIGGSHLIAFHAQRWTYTLNVCCDIVFASSYGAGTPVTTELV